MRRLLVLVLVSACEQAGTSPGVRPARPEPWTLTLQRVSGGPPFASNRIAIQSSGEVASAELCEPFGSSCQLGMFGVLASTEPHCDRADPVLRGRAAPAELARLSRIVHSAEFAALDARYHRDEPDVGSFLMSVRGDGIDKSIDFSPYDELEKVPAGAEVAAAIGSLLSSLHDTHTDCVDEAAAERAVPL